MPFSSTLTVLCVKPIDLLPLTILRIDRCSGGNEPPVWAQHSVTQAQQSRAGQGCFRQAHVHHWGGGGGVRGAGESHICPSVAPCWTELRSEATSWDKSLICSLSPADRETFTQREREDCRAAVAAAAGHVTVALKQRYSLWRPSWIQTWICLIRISV